MPKCRAVAETIAARKSKPFFLKPSSFFPNCWPRLAASAELIALIAIASIGRSVAQEAPKPQGQSGTIATQVGGAAKKPVELIDLLDRKSIVFPDIASNTNALTPGQKFELFVDNSISVHTILWSATGSSFGQALGSPTGWGQGWDNYGKRFGASMARGASGEFFGTFVMASALHEDPRFFPDKNPGFGRAVKYSLRRLFVTRSDDGRPVANISGLVGPLLGEGLANAYYPDRNRTVGDTFFRYGLDIAVRAGGNMLREYWPVVYRKLGGHSTSAR